MPITLLLKKGILDTVAHFQILVNVWLQGIIFLVITSFLYETVLKLWNFNFNYCGSLCERRRLFDYPTVPLNFKIVTKTPENVITSYFVGVEDGALVPSNKG